MCAVLVYSAPQFDCLHRFHASSPQPPCQRSAPVNCLVTYSVLRFAFIVLLSASVAAFGQNSTRNSEAQAPAAAAPQPVSEEVAQAEAAIVKSD